MSGTYFITRRGIYRVLQRGCNIITGFEISPPFNQDAVVTFSPGLSVGSADLSLSLSCIMKEMRSNAYMEIEF